MLFFYIRHGDPIYNPDSLTPLGHRQAEAVARRLALFGVDKIYASTSNRAILTAQPTCDILKKEAELLDFCNESHAATEFSVVSEDGKRRWASDDKRLRQLFASAPVRRLGDNWYEYPAFQDYAFKAGIERISRETDSLFSSLGYEHIREDGLYKVLKPNNDRIALFAHAGFGLAFLSCLLDIPYPQISIHFDMCTSGITVIEFAEADGCAIPRVLTYSGDAHLYREGLPLNYNNRLRF